MDSACARVAHSEVAWQDYREAAAPRLSDVGWVQSALDRLIGSISTWNKGQNHRGKYGVINVAPSWSSAKIQRVTNGRHGCLNCTEGR